MGTLIIAEAGVNHNGSLKSALALCDAAKTAGADIVKFQTFKTEKVLTRSAGMADYQASNLGTTESQFDMVKRLELGFGDFTAIKRYCEEIGIEFLSTPDDEESLNFLTEELGMRMIKVGSGEVTNIPYLRAIGKKNLPVILSTGMATLGEVERALFELHQAGCPDVTLLHCTTNYPCPMDEVNLRAMVTLCAAFGPRVGYSDHTKGIVVPVAAVALGAIVIEKHLTLDNSLPGPDHAASLAPVDFYPMVTEIRDTESALGDAVKRPNPSELRMMQSVRRSIVAAVPISRGAVFCPENLAVKRAGGIGYPAELWDFVVGETAPRDFAADEVVALQ
mgnify:CR=1 FL=1